MNQLGKSIVYSLSNKNGENVVGISSLTTENVLWILAYSNWLKIKEFQLEMKQWVHTCVNFSRLEGIIDVSVDGGEIETFNVENTTATETFP